MEDIESIINYNFKNKNLIIRAMTHPSMINSKGNIPNYETFEFLGDSVLSLVITDYLINTYPDEDEGDLAKRRAYLVSGATLAELAIKLNIGKYMVMADSEESSGGRKNLGNLENNLEAIIGALYLDGGLETAKEFIIRHFAPIAKSMIEIPSNPKTILQEWSQDLGKGIPEYILISSSGPSHAPNFKMKVNINDEYSAIGSGNSKKSAATNAAEILLKKINKNE